MTNDDYPNPDDYFDSKEDDIISPADFLKLMGSANTSAKEGSSTSATSVYLAGPIEKELFLTNPHSLVWRQEVTALFDALPEVWDVKDPCEGKWGVNAEEQMVYVRDVSNEFNYNSYKIFHKDIADLSASSIYLGNFSQMFGMSTGTLFELGFAYAQRIPIVLIASKTQVEHPFLKESADIVVGTVTEAVDACVYLREQMRASGYATKSF